MFLRVHAKLVSKKTNYNRIHIPVQCYRFRCCDACVGLDYKQWWKPLFLYFILRGKRFSVITGSRVARRSIHAIVAWKGVVEMDKFQTVGLFCGFWRYQFFFLCLYGPLGLHVLNNTHEKWKAVATRESGTSQCVLSCQTRLWHARKASSNWVHSERSAVYLLRGRIDGGLRDWADIFRKADKT